MPNTRKRAKTNNPVFIRDAKHISYIEIPHLCDGIINVDPRLVVK